jgi:hypothetical protein
MEKDAFYASLHHIILHVNTVTVFFLTLLFLLPLINKMWWLLIAHEHCMKNKNKNIAKHELGRVISRANRSSNESTTTIIF